MIDYAVAIVNCSSVAFMKMEKERRKNI